MSGDSAIFVLKYQSWIFSGSKALEILQWTGPSNSDYTFKQGCYNDAPCAVTGLTRGSYGFKGQVREQNNANWTLTTPGVNVTIP